MTLRIDAYDAAELAAAIIGFSPPEDDADYTAIENFFQPEYNLDLEDFAKLLTALVPFVAEGISPLTGKRFRGFAHPPEPNGTRRFIIQEEIPE